jgi:hypothetical protein
MLPLLRHSMNTGNYGLFDKKIDINIKPFHLISLVVLTDIFSMPSERQLLLMSTDG